MNALKAAVQSGADAVYFGGGGFSARQAADVISPEEMKEMVDYCHLYGVDAHIAVNILIKEKELDKLSEYIETLHYCNADAVIVQDMGAARIIKQALPDTAVHASTQMTVTSLEGVRFLENEGFDRVVLSRELSKKEIEYICAHAKAEIEVFAHGAICMSYSGQCLMSSILGGRSGNRGRCAQPCRLDYTLIQNDKECTHGCLLSPKDMALINELKTLESIGVTSIKLEGRLKSPEYVSAVTGMYRKYLDSPSKISKTDYGELESAFSRNGFTDGYFKGNLGALMMSKKSASGMSKGFSKEAAVRARGDKFIRKIPIRLSAYMTEDAPLSITMYDNEGNCVTGESRIVSKKADRTPLDEKRLTEQLTKLGQTPFECTDADVYVQDGITIPVKEINDTRRRTCDELIDKRCQREKGRLIKPNIIYRSHNEVNTVLTVQAMNTEQAKAAYEAGIKRIYVPFDIAPKLKFKNTEIVGITPPVFDNIGTECTSLLVQNGADILYHRGKRLYGDFRLNVFNSQTADFYRSLESVTLSPELNLREIRQIREHTDVNLEVIGYGRLPLMLMKNCPLRAAGFCQKGGNNSCLRDRKGEKFPVICSHKCTAVLYNSKPIFMADKLSDLLNTEINSIKLLFTVEKFSECVKIIDKYKKALNKQSIETPVMNTFTRGHYYRGAE